MCSAQRPDVPAAVRSVGYRCSPRHGLPAACQPSRCRSRKSPTARRGVGGCAAVVGAVPTRTTTCGCTCPGTRFAIARRLVGTSVIWVSGQVASPAAVHSSSTADRASPHRSHWAGVSASEPSTNSCEASVSSPRRSEGGAGGEAPPPPPRGGCPAAPRAARRPPAPRAEDGGSIEVPGAAAGGAGPGRPGPPRPGRVPRPRPARRSAHRRQANRYRPTSAVRSGTADRRPVMPPIARRRRPAAAGLTRRARSHRSHRPRPRPAARAPLEPNRAAAASATGRCSGGRWPPPAPGRYRRHPGPARTRLRRDGPRRYRVTGSPAWTNPPPRMQCGYGPAGRRS